MPIRKPSVARGAIHLRARRKQARHTRSSELVWIKQHRAWLSENRSFCVRLVNELRTGGAFDALRCEPLHSPNLECKIAEVIGPSLQEFINESEADAGIVKLEQQLQAFEEAARSLSVVYALRPNDDEAHRLAQLNILKADITSETLAKNRELVRQLKQKRTNVRHAGWLDRICVDMTIVIRSATGAPWNRIFTKLERPILNALRKLYNAVLPPRGFGDPQRRYKRLVAEALRKSKYPFFPTRQRLERLQHRRLMSWDVRFSSAVRRGSLPARPRVVQPRT